MKLNFNNLKLYKDNYNIYNLITKIDSGYRLYFDEVEKNFLIINIAKHNEICMKFSNFSANIIKSLQKSRIENSYNIFSQIDEYNAELINKNRINLKTKVVDSFAEFNRFCKRSSNISTSSLNKFIEGNNA